MYILDEKLTLDGQKIHTNKSYMKHKLLNVSRVGCAVLYTGQGKLNQSTSSTLDYVVGQANLTVENLSNFSSNLAAAKKVSIEQILLPADAQAKIDMVQKKLKSAADELASRTKDNSRTIRTVLQTVYAFRFFSLKL